MDTTYSFKDTLRKIAQRELDIQLDSINNISEIFKLGNIIELKIQVHKDFVDLETLRQGINSGINIEELRQLDEKLKSN